MARVSKRDQIVDDLRRRILAGEWDVGEKLPSLDELRTEYAEILGPKPSRGPVQQALDWLKAEGYVESRHGKGSYVRDRSSPSDPASPATG